MEDDIKFDEADANILYGIVRNHIKENDWDVTDESEWQLLIAIKEIEAKLGKFLNGGA
jgi:hypothetical protein